jgi:hypothetical protein
VPEAAFYRDVVSRTGVRTLRTVAAAIDFDTQDNVLVTEDELGTGARFLHALDPYTPEQAAATLDQLATLHGTPGSTPSWQIFRGWPTAAPSTRSRAASPTST